MIRIPPLARVFSTKTKHHCAFSSHDTLSLDSRYISDVISTRKPKALSHGPLISSDTFAEVDSSSQSDKVVDYYAKNDSQSAVEPDANRARVQIAKILKSQNRVEQTQQTVFSSSLPKEE